jgi:hypothetical protein
MLQRLRARSLRLEHEESLKPRSAPGLPCDLHNFVRFLRRETTRMLRRLSAAVATRRENHRPRGLGRAHRVWRAAAAPKQKRAGAQEPGRSTLVNTGGGLKPRAYDGVAPGREEHRKLRLSPAVQRRQSGRGCLTAYW